MAFTEALRLLIDADTGGAVRGIQKVGAVTDKELGRSQKRIDAWSRGLTTAGAGMVAFGAAGLLGLGKAAQASEKANLSVVKLENTLGNMPRLAGENSASFIKLAQAIQDKTAADADAIVEAEALLGTFQLTGDEIRSITPLVVDYSRKFGVDLNSAAVQVGKALDGNIGALKRVGISIDETAFKADRFSAVQSALRDQVGGFAEAEGKTFAGSLERLKNQMGDVAEGVGVGAVGAFTDLFGVVEGGIDRIKELSPATQEAIGKFATFGSVALIAAGGLSFTIGQLIKMKQNFDIAREAAARFAGSGGLGLLARATVVVGGLIAIREALMAFDRDLEGIDVSTLENQLLDLATTGEIAGDQLAGVFEDFGEAIESGDPQKLEAIGDKLGEVDKALAQLASRDPEAAAAAFRFITDELESMGASTGQIKQFFDDYAAATTQADTASRTAAGGVDELGGAMGEAAEGTSAAQDALQEYLDTLSAMFDPLFGATDALMDNQEAQKAVAVAAFELAAAQKEHGVNSAEAAEAELKLHDAHLKAGKSALDVKQATAELNAAIAENPALLGEAISTLQGWVANGIISEATAESLASQFRDTAAAGNEIGDADAVAKVGQRGAAPTKRQLESVGRAADSVGRKRPRPTVSVNDRASGILRTVQRLIFGIPRSKTFTFNAVVTGMQELNRARALTGRQHGGPVRAHEAYIVGEAGPEILLMGNQSGAIVAPDSRMSGSAAMGAAGSVDVRLHITGTGRLAREFHEGVRTGEIQAFVGGQRVTVR